MPMGRFVTVLYTERERCFCDGVEMRRCVVSGELAQKEPVREEVML